MSHEELQAEYERLKAQAESLLQERSATETQSHDLRQLVVKLQALAKEYDFKVAELEA